MISFKSFGVPADARQLDARTIEFISRRLLPPGEELEVQITFPNGLLNIPLPIWQMRPSQGNAGLRNIALGFTLPMLAAFMLAAFVRHKTKKWRFSYPKVPDIVTTPPSDLCAPAVSILESVKFIVFDLPLLEHKEPAVS